MKKKVGLGLVWFGFYLHCKADERNGCSQLRGQTLLVSEQHLGDKLRTRK